MKRKYKLILEFNEFNQENNQANDPQMSLNSFDRHQDLILQANARLNAIMGGVMNTNTWAALRKALMSDRQEISALKILRILPNNAGDWDVYVEFIIDEKDYWGVIRNITSRDATLTSEVFRDMTNLMISKEWVIRTKGIVQKTIKKFLTPQPGEWRSLKEIIAIDINTGEEKILNGGTVIKVERAFDNRIVFSISNKYYQLSGSNWIYFNWWFERVDD